jgi:hypothetical protein
MIPWWMQLIDVLIYPVVIGGVLWLMWKFHWSKM